MRFVFPLLQEDGLTIMLRVGKTQTTLSINDDIINALRQKGFNEGTSSFVLDEAQAYDFIGALSNLLGKMPLTERMSVTENYAEDTGRVRTYLFDDQSRLIASLIGNSTPLPEPQVCYREAFGRGTQSTSSEITKQVALEGLTCWLCMIQRNLVPPSEKCLQNGLQSYVRAYTLIPHGLQLISDRPEDDWMEDRGWIQRIDKKDPTKRVLTPWGFVVWTWYQLKAWIMSKVSANRA